MGVIEGLYFQSLVSCIKRPFLGTNLLTSFANLVGPTGIPAFVLVASAGPPKLQSSVSGEPVQISFK
jgi:hypothetical protein